MGVVVAVVVAAGLDATVGEPPERIHPVALLGRLIELVADEEWHSPRIIGAGVAIVAPVISAMAAYAVVAVAGFIGVVAAGIVAGVVLFVTTSLRMLLDAATSIVEGSEADTAGARETLPTLVGRDPAALSPGEIRSAAVESAAENLADGLVGPLLFFSVGAVVSLPLAAAGAAAVKAINTLDSTIGYPGDFGWASARFDDIVMYVPARMTAVLIGLAAGEPDAPLRARRYARVPSSPNAGWPMGTLAAALNVCLRKPGAYTLNEVADLPDMEQARDGVRIVRRAGIGAYAVAALLGVLLWL
ncbi:MAG: adenosylcobinamide-phosphate synthase CbiB [Natronomonas sp.]